MTSAPTPSAETVAGRFAKELATAMEPVHEVIYRAAAAGFTPGEILDPAAWSLCRSLGFTECRPDDLLLPRHLSELLNETAAVLNRDPDEWLASFVGAACASVADPLSGALADLVIASKDPACARRFVEWTACRRATKTQAVALPAVPKDAPAAV